MSRRRDERLPRGLERALHGGGAYRAARGDVRVPETWELVVSAVELALLDEPREVPPAGLVGKLARLLDPERNRP